jgi:putative ABC transport system permease protein
MNIFELVRTALESLWSNKMRSVLTMLGVIIGVASVVALLAIGGGVSDSISNQIQGIVSTPDDFARPVSSGRPPHHR